MAHAEARILVLGVVAGRVPCEVGAPAHTVAQIVGPKWRAEQRIGVGLHKHLLQPVFAETHVSIHPDQRAAIGEERARAPGRGNTQWLGMAQNSHGPVPAVHRSAAAVVDDDDFVAK